MTDYRARPSTPTGRVAALAVGLQVVAIVVLLLAVVLPGRAAQVAAPAAAPTAAQAQPEPSATAIDVDGVWAGAVLGDVHPYTVRAEITDSGSTATAIVTYPEIPCVGTWAQTGRSATTVTFTETMPQAYVCYDQVPVTITMNSDGTLFYSAFSGGASLTATLTRVTTG